MSADYQPTWLRLSEARACLMSSSSLSESKAEAWILRAIQDQLRVDAERYNAQTMFQVQGFPTQWKRRRFPRDWPARLTSDRIDWDASTINGPDPFKLIDNDLFIEIRASALPNAPADTRSGLPLAESPQQVEKTSSDELAPPTSPMGRAQRAIAEIRKDPSVNVDMMSTPMLHQKICRILKDQHVLEADLPSLSTAERAAGRRTK